MDQIRARLYGRYSSTNQREESIEGQFRECKEYADRNGLIVTWEYADRALSGKFSETRAQFLRMIKDAEKGLFDVLLVYKMDRFARNRYDAAVYKNKLKKAGVKVVSVRENIPEGAEGIILESVLDGFAEYFSANLSENVRRGAKDSALAGKFIGGQVPYGYKIIDGAFVVDEPRAAVVREVFQRFVAGDTFKEICASLNARGFRTLKGQEFSRGSISSILGQEKYAGIYVYSFSDGDSVQLNDAVPPILSRELWEASLARRQKSKHAPRLGTGQEKYALTGKIFCGHCGDSFHGASCGHGKYRYTYYRHALDRNYRSAPKNANADWCPNKLMIRREKLEDMLFSELNRRVLNADFINEIAEKAVELQDSDLSAETSTAESELKNVIAALDNIYKAIESGLFSQGMQARIADLESRHDALLAEIEAAKNAAGDLLTVEQIVEYMQGFLSGDINDLDFRERLADSFLDRIVIDDGRADVFLKYAEDSAAISFRF